MNNQAHLPRRSFSSQQKITMVRAALQPSKSVAEIARCFNVNQNQLARWIREYHEGAPWRYKEQTSASSAALVPVELADLVPSQSVDAHEQRLEPTPSVEGTKRPTLSASLAFASGLRMELSGLQGDHLKMMLETLQ